jgi:uncharacterized protein
VSPFSTDSDSYVYAVPVREQYLLYAPVGKLVALVNVAAIAEIRTFLRSGQIREGPLAPLATLLPRLGTTTWQDPVERQGPLAPVFLGIIPSRRCNMTCRYCDFRDPKADRQVMAPATAVHAIDFMAGQCARQGAKTYDIQLFGGEPFVEDRIVDTVVHHALFVASRTGITPAFVASTNGLMSPARRRFVGDYFSQVVLSLDGFREFHDRYRPVHDQLGSFDQVVETAHDLSASHARLCIRCCVTSESVFHMEAMARWFCEQFRPAIINFEPMTESPHTQAAGLAPPHPHDFARHSLRTWSLLRSYGCEPGSATVLGNGLQNSSCPVGKDAVIVHPDGTLASCYLVPADWEARGMDLTIGRIHDDGTTDIRMPDVLELRRLVRGKPRCAGCFCRLTCAGGCHVNNTYPSCSDRYSSACIATRILTACTLLEDLGNPDLADDIVTDPEALAALSAACSDRVADFEEGT